MLLLVFAVNVVVLFCRAAAVGNPVSVGNNLFGFNVYKELAKQYENNILFSPFSAESVLALAYFGARSNTVDEMSSALGLPQQKLTSKYFKDLNSLLKTASSNITLTSANKIYVDHLKIKDNFKNTAVHSFDADIESLSFEDADIAAHTINSWVEKQTKNKIRNLVKSDMLKNARMVLVNALYFFGKWHHLFVPSDSKLKFYTSKAKTVDVPMIETTGYFPYLQNVDLNAQTLIIPYKNKDYSLIVVSPNDINGLSRLEEQLPLDLPKFLSKAIQLKVHLEIPKFRIEQKISLNNILKKFGMRTAFTKDARFNGLSDENLLISTVVQKSFIDVSENGTEAAAASGGFFTTYSSVVPFRVDRPFLFMLYQHTTNLVLFVGRVKHL